MNLKVIHVVFVACSTLLAFLFAGWLFAQGGTARLAGGAAAVAAGLGMIAYGVWFWRKITTPDEERRRRRKLFRSVPVFAAVWLLAREPAAWACTVCYGQAEGPMIEAARTGVFLLFGLVFVVQVSLAAFFVYLWRRSRRYHGEIPPWWSDLKEPMKP